MNEIKVLDKGFIQFVDSMGNDQRVVDSARVSYGKGTKTAREDEKLINYLIKNQHWSPFEHCLITIIVKCPMFVRSQWHRHKWSYNEESARYSEVCGDFYVPSEWRGQSSKNKQCSEGTVREKKRFYNNGYEQNISDALHWYKENIKNGMSREMARMILPQSMYTKFYATVNLRSLLHFIQLRDHDHAQYEIREYAKVLSTFVEDKFPLTYKAFKENE